MFDGIDDDGIDADDQIMTVQVGLSAAFVRFGPDDEKETGGAVRFFMSR